MTVILITGGNRGIGASTAIECSTRGMGVVITYRSHAEEAEALVARLQASGGKAAALQLDVANLASFGAFKQKLIETLETTWGSTQIHGLVNNAGFGNFVAIEALKESEFDELLNVHLKGPLFLTQALLPVIEDGGQIVNMTSATTRVATPGAAPYAAFKGSMEVLTRYMAKEFGSRGIRANAISPGAVRTDMTREALDQNPDFEALLASQTALERIATADDVGHAIASLLSQGNRWVNAQSIEVSGGYMI